VRHARNVSLRNVDLNVERPDVRPALVADDVAGLHLARVASWPESSDGPCMWLNDVRGGLVESGIAQERAGALLRVTGEGTQNVTLAGSGSWPAESIDLAAEVAPTAVLHATGSFAVARR